MKNIEWKKSEFDYDALNKLTPAYLQSTSVLEKFYSDSEHQAKAGAAGGPTGGATQGRINVENGHLQKVRGTAIKNRIEANRLKLENNAKAFYDLIETDNWFLLKDVEHLIIKLGYTKTGMAFRLIKLLDLYDIIQGKGNKPSLYKKKKIETLS